MNGKIISFFILALLVWLIIFYLNKEPPEQYRFETYVVEQGDTAWRIMSRNNTANKDIRELIHYMEQDNGIDAGYLQIGQEIKIRIYEKGYKYE